MGMAIGLSCLLLCFVLPGEAGGGCANAQAQGPGPATVPPGTQGGGWTPGKSSAGEITVLGTIRQVMFGQGGVRLLVDGPLGSFDAGLGPYLGPELRQALTVGAAVQLTGMLRSVNGKDVLLVRQIKVGGHEVTLRNANGFLMHSPGSTGPGTPKVHGGAGNGGNQ